MDVANASLRMQTYKLDDRFLYNVCRADVNASATVKPLQYAFNNHCTLSSVNQSRWLGRIHPSHSIPL